MIIAINGAERDNHPDLMQKMHRLRKQVFSDRLGWDVKVEGDEERDEFDDLDPLYLLAMDEQWQLQGCLRLLPTTGPNMLRDVFQELLPDETIESPLIWESTRFCVNRETVPVLTERGLNRTTCELFSALIEMTEAAGLVSIVTVFDALMKRILERADFAPDIIGLPTRIGRVTAYAGFLPAGPEALKRLQAATGLTSRVLDAEWTRQALAA